MKRFFSAITSAALLTAVCTGCALFPQNPGKSFSQCQQEVEDLTLTHGYSVQETFDENLDDPFSCKDLVIYPDSESEIFLRLAYSEEDHQDQAETFELIYTLRGEKSEFNLQLFAELSSSLSGKTLTDSFCREFIQAPEKQYPPEDYGFSKTEEMSQYKLFYLDFTQEHCLSYTLYKDGTAELAFMGTVT